MPRSSTQRDRPVHKRKRYEIRMLRKKLSEYKYLKSKMISSDKYDENYMNFVNSKINHIEKQLYPSSTN
jgi:hypothetical protein